MEFNMDFKALANLYREELTQQVVPFWSKHSVDWEHGGYFTCLDSTGQVYDTDKFIWLQCRQVWWYSKAFSDLRKDQGYLRIAENGAKFLEKFGHKEYDWYFSLTRAGKPLVQPYNIFSNVFAAMAFARLGRITANEKYQQIALKTFRRVLDRKENPKGIYNKAHPETRPLKTFSLPMILCNLSQEMAPLLEQSDLDATLDNAIGEVFGDFYWSEKGLLLEYVTANGEFSDSYDGRLLNPGHAIEAMWFVMDVAAKRNDQSLIDKAVKIVLDTLEYGWDQEYGGIFYFMDALGRPLQQLEWDQKLWWVHLETLISLAKGYKYTQNEACLKWFHKVHAYTWSNFRDPEHRGEWFGYLNRQGEVLMPLKGGKWKGCFHVPRALFEISNALDSIHKQVENE